MEKQLEQAMDDLSMIKMVMSKTRKSFKGFSKVFIGWGIIWTLFSMLSLIQNMNLEKTIAFYEKNSYLVYLIPLVLFGLCALILFVVTKKQPLQGLEKHLMIPWIMVILTPLMRVTTNIDIDTIETIRVTVNNSAIVIFALSILLVTTGIFTELKVFKVIGGLYFLASLVASLLPNVIITDWIMLIGNYIMPFTLLFVGVYLKVYHERSNNGTQYNS